MFKFFLYKLALFFIYRLPLKLSYAFALFLSDMQYYLSPRDRKAVRNNLKVLLPPNSNVAFHAREVFRNFGRYLVEFFTMDQMVNKDYIRRNVKVTNLEYIDHALAKGKGAIFLTAHIGNWELGAVIMSVLGYPTMAIALPHKERPVNDLFNRQREEKGITVVSTHTAVRRCMEQLKDNKIVALAADRDFGANGVVMDFLGKKALIPKGAAIFSLSTGAPIVPMFLLRNADGKFELTCHEPIVPAALPASGIDEERITEMIRRYLMVIEGQIRAAPSQWLVFREFFLR